MFYSDECVAAIATPTLKSGLGVVRVSGKGSIEKVSKIFKPAKFKNLNELKGYEAAYGFIVNLEGSRVDDAVVLVFRAPHSYTGEDVVELSCHGGIAILNLVLNLCFKIGCRPALNGEFTKRAFLNGKLSLTQAEAVYDLINADSNLSLKAASSVKNGFLFKNTQHICNELIELNASLEAFLNYPEEGLDEPDAKKTISKLNEAVQNLQNLVSNFGTSNRLKNGIKTVLVGEPNVGKSTLMNLLSGQEVSIVTQISGTTRDIINHDLEIEEIKFNLSDTAGFRCAKNEIEQIGIEKAQQELEQADLILMVVDGSKNFFNEVFKKIESKKNVLKICVLNKFDLGTFEFEETNLNFDVFIKTSSKNLNSIYELKKAMFNLVKTNMLGCGSLILINERQNFVMHQAIEELQQAKAALESGVGFDAVSFTIEAAIDKLLELNGQKVSEKIIEEIFSKFCVGK